MFKPKFNDGTFDIRPHRTRKLKRRISRAVGATGNLIGLVAIMLMVCAFFIAPLWVVAHFIIKWW